MRLFLFTPTSLKKTKKPCTMMMLKLKIRKSLMRKTNAFKLGIHPKNKDLLLNENLLD